MADSKELKPKSFRIDDKTAEKFKEISAAIGGNQQQTLAKLIEAYEFQSGKAVLTSKKADIEEFEQYITAITRKYMGSLEDNQNLSQTIRAEFDALLTSKDTTIQDLQNQLSVAKQVKEEASSKARMYTDENARLNGIIENLNKEFNSKIDGLQAMLADKDSLNKTLLDSCKELKAKVEGMEKAAGQTASLRSDLEKLQKKHGALIQEQAANEKSLAQQQEQAQLAIDKAVLSVERKYQEQIQALKEKHQAEIDKYQQKYLTLLDRINPQAGTAE